MTTTDTTPEEVNAHLRAAGLPTLPRNATEKQIADALADAAQLSDR